MVYEYTKCEEGCSQYDDYDLSEKDIVSAAYIPARLECDKGNPFIEALPLPRGYDDILNANTSPLIGYSFDKVKNMSRLDKFLQIGSLRSVRFPLPFHEDLEEIFYNTLLTSYRDRRFVVSKNQTLEYTLGDETYETHGILRGDSGSGTNTGFSLIGYSGCGKSSALKTMLSHYPQVIMHDDGKGGMFPQITYLVVNCIANSNFSALYQGIGDEIDACFKNVKPVYARQIEKASRLGKKAEIVKSLVERFNIGIIIFDEIQLIDFEHTKENSFDSLLSLSNRTKVAIAVVGTEDARGKMFSSPRTARRVGNMIDGNAYCNNKQFFSLLVNQIFRYQWFNAPVEVTEELTRTLFEVTRGIIDQLVGIYSFMNVDYIRRKTKPDINGDYVRKIAKKYYPGMQEVLKYLDTPDKDREFSELKKQFDENFNKIINEEKQKASAEHIISAASVTNNRVELLNNIVSNIRNFYTEFSDAQIEEAFKKVTKPKKNAELSEKEISRLVLERLQKQPKRRVSNKEGAFKDVGSMRDYLGIGGSLHGDDTCNDKTAS